jgi:phage terminase large subunit GpA-like protein
VKEWVKRSGDRNEALDCLVYAYAALQLLLRRYDRRTVWEQLQKQLDGGRLQKQKQPTVRPADPIPEPPSQAVVTRRKPQSKRRGNFVSGW